MPSQLILATSIKTDGNLSLRWGKDQEAVLENRRRFVAKAGLRLEDTVVMEVEHGDRVTEVDASHKPRELTDAIATEALMTQEKGLALLLLTADCLPVTLHDPITESLALAHLGWKPTDEGLLLKVVQKMQAAYGCDPDDIRVSIGPGIHAESYRHALPLTSKEELTRLKPFLVLVGADQASIDLVGCNRAQLLEAGIQPEHIQIDPADTFLSQDYFSHYRSVRTGEAEGRFGTLACLS